MRSDGGQSSVSNDSNAPTVPVDGDDDDVADRAEKLLQGLGGDEGEENLVPVPRESILMSRRRKEGAEDERSKRRKRRQLALSASEASLENQHSPVVDRESMVTSEGGADARVDEEGTNGNGIVKENGEEEEEEAGGETPKANGGLVFVSPPSPDLMPATPSKVNGGGILTPPGD